MCKCHIIWQKVGIEEKEEISKYENLIIVNRGKSIQTVV